MGLIVLKYHIFCSFLAKMQDEGFNFFMLSPVKIRHFFLNSFFFLIKTQILSLEGMMNVQIQCIIVLKISRLESHSTSSVGFRDSEF